MYGRDFLLQKRAFFPEHHPLLRGDLHPLHQLLARGASPAQADRVGGVPAEGGIVPGRGRDGRGGVL